MSRGDLGVWGLGLEEGRGEEGEEGALAAGVGGKGF